MVEQEWGAEPVLRAGFLDRVGMKKFKESRARKVARHSKRPPYRTEQEEFWAGQFGDGYTERNRGARLVASNAALLSRILARTGPIRSAIEFGANIGLNLQALRLIAPDTKLAAVEINSAAVAELRQLGKIETYHKSIMEFSPKRKYDLALIKGVLIHINPEELHRVYSVLYRSSGRFICVAEYYNPTPVEIPYRGHRERLFKRDFACDLLDRFRDLKLLDYGFVYRGDPVFPQDDITWFLLEKVKTHR